MTSEAIDALGLPQQQQTLSVLRAPAIPRVVDGTRPLEALAEEHMRAFTSSPYNRLVKPVLDRVAALTLLVLLLPVLSVVALAVRLTLGQPILYRQARVGRNGRTFEVLKFRTILADRRCSTAPHDVERRVTHKTTRDPRHTPLGCFLRRWSLDELPQLLNVLRGDMSLVGPRPELVGVVSTYEPWQHLRHLVKPGLTGWWQVKGRGDAPMHERVDLDLAYLLRPTLARDLRILLATVPAALTRHGA